MSAEALDLDTIARGVAAELTKLTGDTWEQPPADDDYRHAGRVRRADDHGVMVWLHGPGWAYRGRIEAHGDYPRTKSGEYLYVDHEDRQRGAPRVTFAGDRSHKAMASEIARRLLPAYLERLAKLRERVAREDAYADTTRTNAEELARHIGTSARHDDRGDSSTVYQPNGPRYDVHGDRVTIERHTFTLDQAKRIAQMVYDDAQA